MTSSHTNLKSSQMPDRRVVQRYQVDCPATLKMAGGMREGRLTDLSVRGAQFDTPEPPTPGTSGLLGWLDQEQFCTVVWSKNQACGVVFERPVGPELVERSGEMIEIPAGPVAQFDNIPLASRGRRASLVSSENGSGELTDEAGQTKARGAGSLRARLSRLRLVR
ncbi:PilZ domain-containing protein [Qipengyuania sp.]|uniref:PilZ domain-containing protein n=1 Tax=Qipengyuania sp. TaxID=2004515 RepID=UPI0035C7BFAA